MATLPVLRDIPVINYGAQTRAALDRLDAEHDARSAEEVRFAAEQTRRVRVQLIGDQLDQACARFRFACNYVGEFTEARFGRIERDFLEARAAYRALMVELTGESSDDLERRLAA